MPQDHQLAYEVDDCQSGGLSAMFEPLKKRRTPRTARHRRKRPAEVHNGICRRRLRRIA